MAKRILITGSTDGIGLEAAKLFLDQGHEVLFHGRNQGKLDAVCSQFGAAGYLADLSDLEQTRQLSDQVKGDHGTLDVLINNAGVLKTPSPKTDGGLDVRFVVNTIAPFQLTMDLLPIIPDDGRIVNLSSAAQRTVSMAAMAGEGQLEDFEAYAQSKLAITMWTRTLAATVKPVVLSVNPGSLLATNMVREGFNMAGNDIMIGAKILVEAALGEQFADARGLYWDNDSGRFAPPAPGGENDALCQSITDQVARMTL